MATCKECIHEKLCVIKAFPDAFENTQWDKEPCDHFLSTADFVPRSEVVELEKALAKSLPSYCQAISEKKAIELGKKYGRREVAREIFEEIDSIFRKQYELCSKTDFKLLEPILQAERFTINEMWHKVADLKKKYTEENK